MSTIQKFYLHNLASSDSGTLPGPTSLTGTTPNVTYSFATSNRGMDATITGSQVSYALTTTASTSAQKNWFGRWLSAPLAAQTIASGSWTFSSAGLESNTNSAFFPTGAILVWRPSAGAVVGTIVALEARTTLASGTMGTTTTAFTQTFSGGPLGISDGDILVFELWGSNTQSMATSYNNSLSLDGTTEASTTSCAAFLNAPAALTLSSGGGGGATSYPASALIFGC